ncbi:MAG: serine/threonine-protein phosphatase [Clostridia bacterium]|nr:serine/threonine-protein phosphatase [Clostridia bacterium]
MPEKSVREMSGFEKRRHSLEARTFRATVDGCVILGVILLIVGLGLFGVTLTRKYVSNAFYISRVAALSVEHAADSPALAAEVMEIYRGLSGEERARTGTEEYRQLFASARDSGTYAALLELFPQYLESDVVSDVYLAMYDEGTCAMVYLADPDEEGRLYPGEWESVSEKGMRKFLGWDGEGELYDIDRTEKYGWMCTAGFPIRDAEGEIACFVLTDVTVGNIVDGMRAYAVQITAVLIVSIVLIAWLMIRRMKKMVVRPINAIAEAARAYAKDKREGGTETGHFSGLNIRTGDEVENLSLVMADMERDLAEYEENITRITADRERIVTELSLAHRIQAAMMPHIFPPFPDREEFDIYAVMEPAKEVGGDFFDFFLVDDDHLCVIMADVAGKGIPAALFMMASKIILQSCAMLGQSPGEILTKTNEAICSNNQEQMFVTVWLGILEISTGRIAAANAGHEYPALGQGGEFRLYRDRHGFVLGGMEGFRYREYEILLRPGDRLFLYTDGVPEATGADGAMFGTERMIGVLNEKPAAGPEAVIESVQSSVDAFVKDAEQFDDLTMLCLTYNGKKGETRPS